MFRRAFSIFVFAPVAAIAFILVGAVAMQPSPDAGVGIFGTQAQTTLPLEHEKVTLVSSASGFFSYKSSGAWVVRGDKSPVRFHAGMPISVVIRFVSDPHAPLPAQEFILRRLDVKRKRREIVIVTGHSSAFGSSVQTDAMAGALPVKFTQNSQGYSSDPTPLQPGEYALTQPGGSDWYCFGVD